MFRKDLWWLYMVSLKFHVGSITHFPQLPVPYGGKGGVMVDTGRTQFHISLEGNCGENSYDEKTLMEKTFQKRVCLQMDSGTTRI